MQKLLYYAQAWYLVNFNRPLFSDKIEAWDFGPVIPSAYRVFRKFGAQPISYKEKGDETVSISTKQTEFLKAFYGKYIGIPAHAMVNATHNERPWREAFEANRAEISIDLMKEYYSKHAKK